MLVHVSPYLIHIGPIGVRWYGFFMAVSMAVGIWIYLQRSKPVFPNEDALYNAVLLGIVAGIVGARLLYVATSPAGFAAHPAEILRIDHGGLSIHGALLGGFLAGIWYTRRVGAPTWFIFDNAVPGFCVGIMLVRIGNIFNQEVLGHVSDFWFGRQPAQLYGSAMGVILLWLYYRKARENPPDGVLIWYFFFWYSILRFVNEFFRDNPTFLVHYVNNHLGIGALTLTQWFTPPLLAFAYWGMKWRERVGLRSLPAGPANVAALAAPGGEAEAASQTGAAAASENLAEAAEQAPQQSAGDVGDETGGRRDRG